MLRFQFGMLLLLTSLFATLMAGATVLSENDHNAVQAFMSASENCGGTCLLGIQPGVMTVGETMAHLRTHSWVSDLRQNAVGNGFGLITWTWSGEQPALIDTNRQGRITFYWDNEDSANIQLVNARIETITIYTHIRMYSLQNWLGETKSGDANIRPDGSLGYRVSYNITGGMINLTAEMSCPVSMFTYWNAQTRITMTIGRGTSPYVDLRNLVDKC